MVVIINELSFAGHFNSENDFLVSLKPLLGIMKTLGDINYQVFKNYSFFSSKITSSRTIEDLMKDINIYTTEEIRGLRNELYRIAYKPPYWEQERKHNCDNKYTCGYTDLECDYGLAEAVEQDRLVVSINNPSFLSNKLSIKKDNVEHDIFNFFSLENAATWLIGELETGKLSFGFENMFFPNILTSNRLYDSKDFYQTTVTLNTPEKIIKYQKYGHLVAIINGWLENKPLTAKNNNKRIYSKQIRSSMNHLSIDTMHGTFEVFDRLGKHLGEYNFKGELIENPKGHSINV